VAASDFSFNCRGFRSSVKQIINTHDDGASRTIVGMAGAAQDEPQRADTNDLGWLLGTLLRAYLKGAADAVAELPGGPRGYQVLAIAAESACRNQAGIAEHLGVDRTVMTYLLDDLESARLIVRKPDPEDRRSRQILLTAKGRRRLATLTEQVGEVERQVLASLSGAEAEQLRALLSRAATSAADGGPGADACSFA
jgi:DNA-binding MarR family transcriptional regulator